MMVDELTGFVMFPTHFDRNIKMSDSGMTHVYLCVVESSDRKSSFSNISLNIDGILCGDDMSSWSSEITRDTVESAIKSISSYDIINGIGHTKSGMQIPIVSCILIGWSKYSFEYLDKDNPWVANFRSLSSEGRKLYYGMKKLHNEKEVRLITFNKIK